MYDSLSFVTFASLSPDTPLWLIIVGSNFTNVAFLCESSCLCQLALVGEIPLENEDYWSVEQKKIMDQCI